MRRRTLDILSMWNHLLSEDSYPFRCVQILLLHHTLADELKDFRQLVKHLTKCFQLIRYSEAVDRILHNRIDARYLAFSFDDGQHCCLQAADILEQFGARACFFVCPQIVGETDDAKLKAFCRDRLRHPAVGFLDWEDLSHLLDRGHEIGGHTLSHVNLGDVSPQQADDEIRGSFEALSARLGLPRHFAWPYGQFRHVNRLAVQAVFAAGYQSCASGIRGCHGSPPVAADALQASEPHELCLRRESIVANWPLRHILYFLNKSARRPIGVDESWPVELNPHLILPETLPCMSSLTPSRSVRAAG